MIIYIKDFEEYFCTVCKVGGRMYLGHTKDNTHCACCGDRIPNEQLESYMLTRLDK